MFTFSTKREIRHFHVVVVQRRQRNVQKSVMHVQSCCFFFCQSKPIAFSAFLVSVVVALARGVKGFKTQSISIRLHRKLGLNYHTDKNTIPIYRLFEVAR